MSDEQTLEAIVGGLALDLIGAIKPAMEGEGDAAEDFKITGALLFVTCEDAEGAGWYFHASNPDTYAMKLGLTEMAWDVARGKGVAS